MIIFAYYIILIEYSYPYSGNMIYHISIVKHDKLCNAIMQFFLFLETSYFDYFS